MDLILLIAAAGLLLLLAEAFLPGGVLGIIGGLALIVAIVLGFVWYGMLAGSILLVGLGGTALTGFAIWMSFFARTAAGRKLLLAQTLPSGSAARAVELPVGTEGAAVSPLRPGGRARFGDVTADVTSESDFIEAGASVVIVSLADSGITVRKKS